MPLSLECDMIEHTKCEHPTNTCNCDCHKYRKETYDKIIESFTELLYHGVSSGIFPILDHCDFYPINKSTTMLGLKVHNTKQENKHGKQ